MLYLGAGVRSGRRRAALGGEVRAGLHCAKKVVGGPAGSPWGPGNPHSGIQVTSSSTHLGASGRGGTKMGFTQQFALLLAVAIGERGMRAG